MTAGWIVTAGCVALALLVWWLYEIIDRKHMRDSIRETEAIMQQYGMGGRCHACGRKLPHFPNGE